MNWGYKIALVYGGFVVFMGILVGMCMVQDDIHLVSKDYYKEEIAYQDVINQMENVNSLKEEVKLAYQADLHQLNIDFPEESLGAKGEIWFFRPSDARKDFKVSLDLVNNATQSISTHNLDRGYWKVKINWQKDNKTFFNEQTLILN